MSEVAARSSGCAGDANSQGAPLKATQLAITMVDLLSPQIVQVDILIAITSFLAGLFVNFRRLKNMVIFLQAALLLLKMAKHFYETHPEARHKKNGQEEMIDSLHRDIVKIQGEPFPSGAIG